MTLVDGITDWRQCILTFVDCTATSIMWIELSMGLLMCPLICLPIDSGFGPHHDLFFGVMSMLLSDGLEFRGHKARSIKITHAIVIYSPQMDDVV